MHFDLLESITLAGDHATPNDDRVGIGDALAWVIDGATDLGPPGLMGPRGGAAWLAGAADAAFAGAPGGSAARACHAMFAAVEARYARERQREPDGAWELPCASVFAAALHGDAIECGWIGDCAALHRSRGTVRWLGPPPDRARESAQAAALGSGIGATSIREPAVLADRRAARGRPGRRVLGVDAAASAAALMVRHVAAAPGDELLLMSDGFSALVDAYALFDADDLFDAVAERGLAALAIELRAIEAADAACTRFPRFKASDDATALWVRVG